MIYAPRRPDEGSPVQKAVKVLLTGIRGGTCFRFHALAEQKVNRFVSWL